MTIVFILLHRIEEAVKVKTNMSGNYEVPCDVQVVTIAQMIKDTRNAVEHLKAVVAQSNNHFYVNLLEQRKLSYIQANVSASNGTSQEIRRNLIRLHTHMQHFTKFMKSKFSLFKKSNEHLYTKRKELVQELLQQHLPVKIGVFLFLLLS